MIEEDPASHFNGTTQNQTEKLSIELKHFQSGSNFLPRASRHGGLRQGTLEVLQMDARTDSEGRHRYHF